MTPTQADIVRLHDKGQHPDAIHAGVGGSLTYVYATLREYRPKRKRKPRRRTSAKPDQVKALHKIDTAASEIARLLDVTPAYVYRILAEA